jgi:alpha-tubulin suppressor-like RCC1 family protein
MQWMGLGGRGWIGLLLTMAGCPGGGDASTAEAPSTASTAEVPATTTASTEGTTSTTASTGVDPTTTASTSASSGATDTSDGTSDATTGDPGTTTDSSGSEGTTGGACAPGFEACPSGCCLQVIPDRLIVGENHTCALSMAGGVKCWGWAGLIGVDTDSSVPVQVPGLAADVIGIAGGDDHTCALLSGGGVKCWGGNYWGGLGDGMAGINIVVAPVSAVGLTDVTAIWAGRGTSCARRDGGEIWCWGRNDDGQLGLGTESATVGVPTLAKELTGISVVAPASVHACGLAGGAVKCWGRNHLGQLGNGSLMNSVTPVEVSGLAQSASFIVETNGAHSCAVVGDGSPVCWGNNDYGMFGNGDTQNIASLPQLTIGLPGPVVALSAGSLHTCAIVESGAVWCWGEGGAGQLGTGTSDDQFVPVEVVDVPAPAVAIAAGGLHTCALTIDDTLYCWGNNSHGQLGTGNFDPTSKPVPVQGL